jgi:hypothetical protein
MMKELTPIQKRVEEINADPNYIVGVLLSGAGRCRAIVEKVMDEVRQKVGVKSSG